MSVSGYKDGTTFLVSINKDTGVVDKYLALSNGDTKGLGSKVMDSPFRKSIEGKKAVTAGINEAAGYVDELKGE